MRYPIAAALGLLLLALGSACGGRADFWEEELETAGPIEAAERLVWLHRTARLLTWIEPGADEATRSVAIAPYARGLAPWARGVAVVAGRGDAPVLELVSLPGGEKRRLQLPAAWDQIAVAPDGVRALLSFATDATPPPGASPVRNLNQVGVVHLEDGRVENVVLPSESLAPRQVVFAPAGSLAALLYDDGVAFVDLDDPERRVRVDLKLRDGRALLPAEALFSPGGGVLFVRTAGTDDVVALELAEGADELEARLNFLFLAGARSLQDIAVAPELGEAVVALYAGQVAVLDAGGDTTATRATSLSVQLDRIADLGDGLLLLYAGPGSFAPDPRAIAAWDPLEAGLAIDRLEQPLAAEPVVAQGSAFLPQGGAATGVLTVAAVERDPVRLRLALRTLQLDGVPTAAAAHGEQILIGLDRERLDRGGSGAGENAGGAVAVVEAGSLLGDGLVVDAPVVGIGVIGGHVWAQHEAPLGDVTLVPRNRLRREAARRYQGVLASDLLDRGEER